MDAPAPKKRGRKPKSETQILANPTPATKRRGKLNIVAVEDEEDEDALLKDNKEAMETTLDSQFAKLTVNDEDDAHLQTPLAQTLLTIDVAELSGTSRCSLERRPACGNRPGYFPLLQDFIEVYPCKTDVACWWCCHPFTTHPIGIPMRYDKELDVFKVVGCFCSFNCAYAHSRKEKYKILPADFRFMYVKMKGTVVASEEFTLQPAPERFLLKKFGGFMSIEEYRASFMNCYEIMFTPMMPFGMLCDEVLGRSLSKGWTKDGIRRPLEIRRAKKDVVVHEPMPVEKRSAGRTKQRTTVTQMISFEDGNNCGNYAERWA